MYEASPEGTVPKRKEAIMETRFLGGCIVPLASLAFLATTEAQELPLLQPDAAFSNTGCYSFLPRCFVVAESLEGSTAVTITTAATVVTHARSASGWSAQHVIMNPDYPSPPTMYSPPRVFGFPVGFSGDSLLIGGTSGVFSLKDVVYAFERRSDGWHHVRTLAPPRPSDYYATVVTGIAVDGNTAAVSGVRYRWGTEDGTFEQIDIYKRDANGTWIRRASIAPPTSATHPYTHSLALEGDTLLIANAFADDGAGRVFIYENLPASWKLRQTLAPPAGEGTAAFGAAMDIDAARIAIVAPGLTATGSSHSGAALLFERLAGIWQEVERVTPPPDLPEDEAVLPDPKFATQVRLSGSRLIVDFEPFEAERPYAYVYEHRGTWQRVAALENLSAGSHTAALNGDVALINVGTGFSTGAYSVVLPALGTLPPR
jgi:hypothetical protein